MEGDSNEFNVLIKDAERLTICGENEKAEKVYTRFIEQVGNSIDRKGLAVARNNRGHLKYLKVDFYGAVEDYTEALKLDPNLAVCYYNRGQIHYRMGRFGMAIVDLKKAVELDASFQDARTNLKQAEEDHFASKKFAT